MFSATCWLDVQVPDRLAAADDVRLEGKGEIVLLVRTSLGGAPAASPGQWRAFAPIRAHVGRGYTVCEGLLPESRPSRKERDMSTPPSPANENRTNASFLGLGIGVGVAIGAAIGVATHQIALGVGLGVGIGTALGLSLQMSQRARSRD